MHLSSLNDFVLVGGTALSLQYGHRKSIDLDFFGSVDRLNAQAINDQLETLGEVKLATNNSVMLGFYVDGIKIDIVNYKYKLIEPYITEDSIRLAHPKDIGAMKLAAISGRGKRKDFYDLFFILKNYSLKDLLEFNRIKFPDSNEMIVLKSIGYFEDADNDPEIIQQGKVNWIDVKLKIKRHLLDYINETI